MGLINFPVIKLCERSYLEGLFIVSKKLPEHVDYM